MIAPWVIGHGMDSFDLLNDNSSISALLEHITEW